MKLNLGCGFKKIDGFANVDKFEGCQPDLVCDLTQTPWPWADSSIDEVRFDFSLEQIGETAGDLAQILKELYRISKNETKITVWFFHPRHDQFFYNPFCKHRLSIDFFRLLSVQQNLAMIPSGSHDSALALELGVNFEVTKGIQHVSEDFKGEFESGRLTEADLIRRIRFENNIVHAVEIEMTAIKR